MLWPVQGVAEKLGACVAKAEHCSVNELLQHLQVLSPDTPWLHLPDIFQRSSDTDPISCTGHAE